MKHSEYLIVEVQSLIVWPRYTQLFQRFMTTFPFDVSTAVYYLPGNNDVG